MAQLQQLLSTYKSCIWKLKKLLCNIFNSEILLQWLIINIEYTSFKDVNLHYFIACKAIIIQMEIHIYIAIKKTTLSPITYKKEWS